MQFPVLASEYRPWAIVLASILVHGTVFTLLHTFLSRTVFGALYNKLTKREQMRFDERMVAMLHACVSCQGSIRAFFSVLPHELTVKNIVFLSGAFAFVPLPPFQNAPQTHFTHTLDSHREDHAKWELTETYLCITLGYFLYDTLIYLFVSRGHPFVDLMHHFVSEGQYIIHIALRWGYFLPTCLQTNEISTPFVHLSWFAAKAGEHGFTGFGRLFSPFQITFGVLFLLSRILFNTALFAVTCYTFYYYVFVVDTVPKYAIVVSFVNFCLYLVVQYFWFFAILRKFVAILHGNASAAWGKNGATGAASQKNDKKADKKGDKKTDKKKTN